MMHRSFIRSVGKRACFLCSLLLAGCVVAADTSAPPAGTRPQAVPSLDDFRLITERNIFNPNRGPRQARAEGPSRAEPARTETLALLGTLGYEKGWIAVFGGSESSYRRSFKVSDSVAGCTIRKVDIDQVELEHNGRQIQLKVGMRLERTEEGDWSVAGLASPPEARSALAAATNRPAITSEDDDVLKRLLEKRQQEMKNEK